MKAHGHASFLNIRAFVFLLAGKLDFGKRGQPIGVYDGSMVGTGLGPGLIMVTSNRDDCAGSPDERSKTGVDLDCISNLNLSISTSRR